MRAASLTTLTRPVRTSVKTYSCPSSSRVNSKVRCPCLSIKPTCKANCMASLQRKGFRQRNDRVVLNVELFVGLQASVGDEVIQRGFRNAGLHQFANRDPSWMLLNQFQSTFLLLKVAKRFGVTPDLHRPLGHAVLA